MIKVAALYQFTAFADPASLRAPLLATCEASGVRGTLLLAREGINGTIAGSPSGIAAVLAHIRALPGCAGLDWKESTAAEMPFGRMKVRLKREIVTMGEPEIDPRAGTGHYVAPGDWNALIRAPDVVVIDTRNDYEVSIGTFEGAIDPGTKSFRDFPQWWRDNAGRFGNKRVAMFCTGGIRCEKSTNFLLREGVSEVYHLKGGILKYLEDVPASESLWQGECFVFDQRVSVGHGLKEGQHGLCHACRRPIGAADRAHPDFEEGVACPACKDDYSETQRERFRERQRQMELAGDRGDLHLGQRLDRASDRREKRCGPASDQS
ncbi:MAG: rhodanese-related sulfurtransferase [Rhodobacteraceae bacterium]|nr:rhodanese-related sulfurtransferase [Paracoccaceae bacterium]